MADLLMKMPIPYEPKRQNRFILRFPTTLGINEWFVESTARPHITINPVEIPFLNTSTYVAGRFTWGTINVKFRDPIGPSASQALMEWVRLCAESVTGRMGYAAGYKKNVDLEMLDPTGVVVEKWILEGTFLSDVNFDSLAYNTDALASITATLRMDRCILVYQFVIKYFSQNIFKSTCLGMWIFLFLFKKKEITVYFIIKDKQYGPKYH